MRIPIYRAVRYAPIKAPLCKGGSQKSLIFDWGIVRSRCNHMLFSDYTSPNNPSTAQARSPSLCTREALYSATNRNFQMRE